MQDARSEGFEVPVSLIASGLDILRWGQQFGNASEYAISIEHT